MLNEILLIGTLWSKKRLWVCLVVYFYIDTAVSRASFPNHHSSILIYEDWFQTFANSSLWKTYFETYQGDYALLYDFS